MHLVALVALGILAVVAVLQLGQCQAELGELADDFRAIGDR